MSLTADVRLTLGTLELEVGLHVEDEDVVAIVGPNGAGKTTLLRALAGLVPLSAGRVAIGDTVVEDTAGRIRFRPEERNLGVVFQEHRLFEHLSALENVAFGLRARRVGRVEARRRAAEWLGRVGLADVGELRPRELSGGQAQRVALARALAVDPAGVLLDEPLAAVDASARADLRQALREQLGHYPGARVVVTHDPAEAAALADRLVVLENGRITQQGALVDVTARPRSPWVATMVGLNLLEGRADGHVVLIESGGAVTTAAELHGRVFVAFRPNAVVLHRAPPEGSARNVWPGEVDDVYRSGDRVRVRISGDVPLVAEVTAAAVAALGLTEGGPVWASVKATDVDAYPA